jgi:predicted transcriptional regulator
MKKNSWLVHLYEDTTKTNLLKVMEFQTIKDISYVLGIPSQTISNYFHGLIKPRGILTYCIVYQSIPL